TRCGSGPAPRCRGCSRRTAAWRAWGGPVVPRWPASIFPRAGAAGMTSGTRSATIAAQARLVAALGVSSRQTLVRRAAEPLTPRPRLDEVELAGVAATLARPADEPGPWPALVFVNGVTARGRAHPAVRQLACALARAGHCVLVPDPPGLAGGVLGAHTV